MIRLSTLREFSSLRGSEMVVAVTALHWLVGLYLALRVFSFERIKKTLEKFPLRERPSDISINRILDIVKLCSQHATFTDNCLLRSLASLKLLRSNGYSATLRIGAKRNPEGGIAAHAWLESSDGSLLIDEESLVAEYVELG